jgi:hypothetical protein
MALRNRQEQEADELGGVILEVDASNIKLGRFESLQGYIPGELKAIKKKRGVDSDIDPGASFFASALCFEGGGNIFELSPAQPMLLVGGAMEIIAAIFTPGLFQTCADTFTEIVLFAPIFDGFGFYEGNGFDITVKSGNG